MNAPARIAVSGWRSHPEPIPYVWRDPAASPERTALTRAILAQVGDEPDSWDLPQFSVPATGRAWPAYRLRACGTEAAYRRHLRRRERPCDECKDANRRGVALRTGREAS